MTRIRNVVMEILARYRNYENTLKINTPIPRSMFIRCMLTPSKEWKDPLFEWWLSKKQEEQN